MRRPAPAPGRSGSSTARSARWSKPPGEGATQHLILPVAAPLTQTTRSPHHPGRGIHASCNANGIRECHAEHVPLRTLIVDDSAAFLAVARTILERSEFMVVGEAKTAGEALRQVEELDPDVIPLDINLGEDSGFAVAKRLSERADDVRAKVILISAHPERVFADLIAESESAGFITKEELSARSLTELLQNS